MKRNILLIIAFVLLCFCPSMAQTSEPANDSKSVIAVGNGTNREEARKDALRNAIEQAVGTSLSSQSKMENFALVEDAVSTRSTGYITNYDITKEGQKGDQYEMEIKANVSLSALKADFRTLAQAIGGVRFMVIYDPRTEDKDKQDEFDFAVERLNEQLSNRKYRYIESKRFKQLASEAQRMLMDSDTNELTFAQRLGVASGAQFIWFIKDIRIKKSTADFARNKSKVTIELKAYDNCTAEGLGTVLLESDWGTSNNSDDATRAAIAQVAKDQVEKMLNPFTSYIGDWVNNGTPYEIRFYSFGTFRDLRNIRQELKKDPNFGGEMEIQGADNYQKLNLTFKKTPDDLADKILDLADIIPAMRAKRLDVKLIYGRQISFAPSAVDVPELQGVPNEASPSTSNPTKAITKVPPKQKYATTKPKPKNK
jgi:hypothetical protein